MATYKNGNLVRMLRTMRVSHIIVCCLLSGLFAGCKYTTPGGRTLYWPATASSAPSPQRTALNSACSEIELMGVYATDPVVGLSHFFAKVRNRTTLTKIVTVGFYPRSSLSIRDARNTLRERVGDTGNAHVKGGDIARILLDTSDRPPSDVHLISCE